MSYNAQKEELTADSVKALADEAVRIKREEEKALLSEYESLKLDTIRVGQSIVTDETSDRYGLPYMDQSQIFDALATIDKQYEIDQVTTAAANADFFIKTAGQSVVNAYADDIEKMYASINQAKQDAFAAAQQAANDEAANAGLNLNTTAGQQQYREVFDRNYQSELNSRLYDIEGSMPDPAAVTGIQQYLENMAPIIESTKQTVAKMESLGQDLPDGLKDILADSKAFLETIEGMQELTNSASEILLNTYDSTGTDYSNKALDAAKQQQANAQRLAQHNQAQADAQALATPEGRAQAVVNDLQAYSDSLNQGLENIKAAAMGEARANLLGVDMDTEEGKTRLKEAAKEIITEYADSIDGLVPQSVRDQAKEALQTLLPDINAAREQAAQMGDNVTPELRALLDMYDQIEQLAAGGSDLVTQLQNSIDSSASSAGGSAATQMGDAITTGVESQKSAVTASGADYGQGWVNGVLSKLPNARSAGIALAKATEKGAKDEAKIASPSVVAMTDGGSWSDGWYEGVLKGIQRAYDAGAAVADATSKGADDSSSTPTSSTKSKARAAAELAALKAHGQELLDADRQAYQARIAQQEQLHSVMMAMIGDDAAWYADTTLEKSLEETAAYYKAQQDAIKEQYDADMAKAKNKAQKDALTEAYNARIALINEQNSKEQEALRENYEVQQRIALDWINNQKELLTKQLADKQEAARKEDYDQELADLQKRQRQSKSARERRELQNQIDDMIRDEALRQEEQAAQDTIAVWDKLAAAISAGIIGLGDLTGNTDLSGVALGSGGLGALTDISPIQIDDLLSSLAASQYAGNSGVAMNNYNFDIHDFTVRNEDDIQMITDRVMDGIEETLRSQSRD